MKVFFSELIGVDSWLVSKRELKFNDEESCWFDEILFNLFVKFPLFNIVVVNEDDDELDNFIGIDNTPNSLAIDLFVIGDVKNGDKQKFSSIGVFVLALAVWWCKLDKDEGVSRLTRG